MKSWSYALLLTLLLLALASVAPIPAAGAWPDCTPDAVA